MLKLAYPSLPARGYVMPTFFDSTPSLDDAQALRTRMRQDGYLFIRRLLPAGQLAALRLRLLAIARDNGWVQKNSPLTEAIADQTGFCVEPTPEYMDTAPCTLYTNSTPCNTTPP